MIYLVRQFQNSPLKALFLTNDYKEAIALGVEAVKRTKKEWPRHDPYMFIPTCYCANEKGTPVRVKVYREDVKRAANE
jgi:hypothetical protein